MSQAGTETYALFSFAPFPTFPAFPSCLLLSDPDLPQAPLLCCFPHRSSCGFETLPHLKVSHSFDISLKWWDEAYGSMNSPSLQLLFLRIRVLRQGLAVRYNRWSAGSALIRSMSNCMLFSCSHRIKVCTCAWPACGRWKRKIICPNPLWFLFHCSPLLLSIGPDSTDIYSHNFIHHFSIKPFLARNT